jgi:hypothetical protein
MVAISEKEFQNKVVALAIMYGWRVTHFRASQVGGKWMTAIQGHSGFPDLVHRPRAQRINLTPN